MCVFLGELHVKQKKKKKKKKRLTKNKRTYKIQRKAQEGSFKQWGEDFSIQSRASLV